MARTAEEGRAVPDATDAPDAWDGQDSVAPESRRPVAGWVRWRFAGGAVLVVLAIVIGGTAVLLLQFAATHHQSQGLDGIASPAVSVPALTPTGGPSGPSGPGTASGTAGAGERADPNGTGGTGTAEPSGAGEATVLVHVAGAVVHPGIVELPANSRVYQAIQRAGGQAPDAALDAVNLAAPLQDGEQLLVPTRQQADNGYVAGLPAGTGEGTGVGTGLSGSSTGTTGVQNGTVKAGSRINLNTATEAALTTLPRVGPVLAQRIIAWRTGHGRFSSVQELDAVEGVGPKMLESLLPLVTV